MTIPALLSVLLLSADPARPPAPARAREAPRPTHGQEGRPAFAIEAGDASAALTEAAGRRVKLDATGARARVHDKATGRPIGPGLGHRPSLVNVNPPQPFLIRCWAFSTDGRFLATGAGNRQPCSVIEGEVIVWEVATGKEVARRRMGLGTVNRVAFGEDGRTVLYEADRYYISSP